MSREGKLAKNTIILSIGTFLPKLASFITLPILTGYLTKEDYGTYDLVIVLASLLLPATTLQIQSAAFRFLIDVRDNEKEKKGIVSNIFIFLLPVSLLCLLILYFCLFKFSAAIRLSICLYFFFDIVVSTTRQVVRGLSHNLKYSISAIISSGCQLIFVLLLVQQLEQGLVGGVLALTFAEILSFLYLLFSARLYRYIDFSTINKSTIKSLLAYSWPMVPNNMSMWVMRMSDRLVVTLFMGLTANAVYSVANKIPQLLTLAQSTFTMAWQENASIVSKDEDAENYYSLMFRRIFDLMAGFLGIIIAATPLLFIILIRGDYSEAYIQIPILVLSMFFFAMSTFLGGIYVAYMKTKSVGITTITSALINLVVDIALIHFIGLYAASGSTLVSYIFLFFFRLIDVQKIIKLTYSKIHLIVVLTLIVVECILCIPNLLVFNILNAMIAVVVFFALNKSFIYIMLKKMKKIVSI